MSRIALTRLVSAGNRSSRMRLAGVAAGVMIGVMLFSLLWAASEGIGQRSERGTWMNLDVANPPLPQLTPENSDLAADTMAAARLIDTYQGRLITVVSVATTGSSSVVIPGAAAPPKPGEYLASPAVAALIEGAPANELGDRYGDPVGVISPAGLEGPDALVVVTGTTVDTLLNSGADARVVSEFVGYDYASQAYRIIAIIGAIAVLIPVLLLISIITELGAAQRAERFAALRLIGATPRTVAGIAAIETAATTLIGAALGVGLYYAVLPLAARIQVSSGGFYVADLMLGPGTIVTIAVVTVAAATAVAWWRTLRADLGPLGGSRERRERRPRLVSLVPLLAGLLVLGGGVWLGSAGEGAAAQFVGVLMIAGFILTALGLLWAGPLLSWCIAKAGARHARSASQIVAFGRVAQHPRASFRAVSGLVAAVFFVTVFATAITAAAGVSTVAEGDGYLPSTTLVAYLGNESDESIAPARAEIAGVAGVESQALGYYTAQNSVGGTDGDNSGGEIVLTQTDAASLGLVSTNADASGAEYFRINPNFMADAPVNPQPRFDIDPAELSPGILLVSTDGTSAGIERARTAIVTSGLQLSWQPTTRADNAAVSRLAPENQFAAMAYIGILIAASIAAVSLAVAALASVLDRKRVFALLRLSGMPRRTLRSIITIETVLPVATALVASIGLGVFTAWTLIDGLTDGTRSIGWPEPGYYLVLALCLAFIAGAIALTLRSATAITSGASTRFE